VAKVAKHFGINGEHFLIDAACASSIVALEMALQRLKLYQSDLVIAGGIESNLGFGSYVAFSTVGALAKKDSLPFDERSTGIVQGEGTVLFALKRLEDAVRDGDHIHGVIKSVAGSSDGRSASLFQPNANGQEVVYKKIYGDSRDLCYLEAHGTGTQVGDKTEMESITSFFAGKRFPVGTAKAVVGHTKGTAGAVGVLKSLFILKEKVIPASAYIEQSVFKGEGPYINSETTPIDTSRPARIGVNAFGFGGTNYHLLLEEWNPGASINVMPKTEKQPIVSVAEATVDLESFSSDGFLDNGFPFRLPPNAVDATDEVQLAGLLASWKCIQTLGKRWNFIDKQKVNVVSACTLFLDDIDGSMHRMAYEIFSKT
ncbi:MAG: polyketide synthase, partial [Bdellovibrionota bacterium]